MTKEKDLNSLHIKEMQIKMSNHDFSHLKKRGGSIKI